MEKPIQQKEINLTKLRKVCQEYIDYVDSDDYHEDNDYSYYIFEEAMQTIFGEDVFKFINKKI